MLLYAYENLKIIRRLTYFFAITGCVLLTGCDRRSQDYEATPTPERSGWERHVENAWEEAQKAVDSLSPIKDQVTSTATEEVRKLFAVEYRVIELAPTSNAAEIEAMLSALGTERWDCFHVLERAEALRLLCKRRPESWLRHMGRIAPFLPLP